MYYAPDLRRRNTAREARSAAPILLRDEVFNHKSVHPFDLLDEDSPFGWTPQNKDPK
jgi:hypothetical protein